MSQIPIVPDEASMQTAPTSTEGGAGKAPAPEGSVNPLTVGIILLAIIGLAVLKPDIAKTALVFVVTLSILVFVHEWGHFQFARWAGMKVNRFAIGFPPFIYTKRVRGIDYSVGALPIGGMVDIAGLGSEEEMVHTVKGEGQTPVKNTARPFGQRQFQDGSLLARFMVLFAGPLMNFILAIAISVGLFSVIGTPDFTTPGIKANYVAGTFRGSPAAKAGVQSGDSVVGVGQTLTDDPETLTKLIRKTPKGAKIDLKIKHDGKIISKSIVPELSEIPGVKGKVPTVGVSFDVDPTTITKYNRLGIVDATKIRVFPVFRDEFADPWIGQTRFYGTTYGGR